MRETGGGLASVRGLYRGYIPMIIRGEVDECDEDELARWGVKGGSCEADLSRRLNCQCYRLS